MRDRLMDLLDRLPRWGELSRRGRLLSAAIAIIVVATITGVSVWATGGDSEPPVQATGPAYEAGFAPCSRSTSANTNYQMVSATIGDAGLPYHANLADVVTNPAPNGKVAVVILVCMEPGATTDQLKDVATVLAQNVKKSPQAATIDAFGITNIGDGDDRIAQVVTYFQDHPFTANGGVYAQRNAWEILPIQN